MSQSILETVKLTGDSVENVRKARHDAFEAMVHSSDDATDGVRIHLNKHHLKTARFFLLLQGSLRTRRRKHIS